jgi:hypothetical protein
MLCGFWHRLDSGLTLESLGLRMEVEDEDEDKDEMRPGRRQGQVREVQECDRNMLINAYGCV